MNAIAFAWRYLCSHPLGAALNVLLLSLLAAAVRLVQCQGFAAALGWFLQLDNTVLIDSMAWPVTLTVVPALALGVSLGAALLPAFGAYRASVLELVQTR